MLRVQNGLYMKKKLTAEKIAALIILEENENLV